MSRELTQGEKILIWTRHLIRTAKSDEMSLYRSSNRGLYRSKMTDKYIDFFNRYPSLFNSIVDLDDPNQFEIHRLEKMLRQKAKVDNGNVTYEKMSKKVGKEYYNEFMKNTVETKLNKTLDVYDDVSDDDD